MLLAILSASAKGGRPIPINKVTLNRLMIPKEFKKEFYEGEEPNEGWYAFVNGLTGDGIEFKAILFDIWQLEKGVVATLRSGIDKKTARSLKNLRIVLSDVLKFSDPNPETDGEKVLCRFLWAEYTGWNWDKGNYSESNTIVNFLLKLSQSDVVRRNYHS